MNETTAVLNDEAVEKVMCQVEFYFSNTNLPRDKFLRKNIEESDDGRMQWSVLAYICSFWRTRSHLGLENIKADEIAEETGKAVADVVRKSTSLKISDNGVPS